jgi:hypothetical protein
LIRQVDVRLNDHDSTGRAGIVGRRVPAGRCCRQCVHSVRMILERRTRAIAQPRPARLPWALEHRWPLPVTVAERAAAHGGRPPRVQRPGFLGGDAAGQRPEPSSAPTGWRRRTRHGLSTHRGPAGAGLSALSSARSAQLSLGRGLCRRRRPPRDGVPESPGSVAASERANSVGQLSTRWACRWRVLSSPTRGPRRGHGALAFESSCADRVGHAPRRRRTSLAGGVGEKPFWGWCSP